VVVDVCLNVIWQLRHKTHINLRLNSIILVISPIVLKVPLKALGHLLGQRAAPIEMSEETKPFGKVLTIFVVSGHILKVHENINELAHDVREASDADQENEGRDDTLDLTLGIIVTETHS